MADDLEPVTIERDGRLFSGIGLTEESVDAEIDAREPAAERTPEDSEADSGGQPNPDPAAQAKVSRDDTTGQFKKEPRGPKRFQQLTAEREEAKRAAQEANERALKLEERLKALEERTTKPPSSVSESAGEVAANQRGAPATAVHAQAAATAQQQAQTGQPATRPQPKEDDIGTVYKTYAEFVADTAAWVMEQRFQTLWSQKEEESAVRSYTSNVASQWREAESRGKQAYPDFDRVVAPLMSLTLDGPVLEALATHPEAEHLVYKLASDPALFQQFAGSRSPAQQGLLLGQLLASAGARPASPRQASSNPPPPVQPVGGGSKTTVPSLHEIAETGDYEAYRARRAQERKAGRR